MGISYDIFFNRFLELHSYLKKKLCNLSYTSAKTTKLSPNFLS